MNNERMLQPEELYARGLDHLRQARWDDAVETLSKLRSISTAYPDVDRLIADALLKIEIERAHTPDGVAPPKPNRFLRFQYIVPIVALLVIGGALLILLRPTSVPAALSVAPTSSMSLPTPAPTNTPLPTATAVPTATPIPTATPVPTATPQPGPLVVRMADGQPLVRTIGNIEIILDASGSMRAKIDGRRKIDIAHESLAALVDQLPDAADVALRSYGHRRSEDCNDIELLVPFSPLDRAGLKTRISAVNPAVNGRTPMALSLLQLAEDLKDARGDVLVILVSDGDETCDGDPGQAAAQIHASNPRIRIDVIGFNVGPEEWRARLSAIAQGGGGNYYDAADATQLAAALQQAVALTYRVRDANGMEVYQGALGSTTTLPAGRYTIEIGGDDAPLTIGHVEVGGPQPATVELREQDGVLVGAVVAGTKP
jgi:Ca-activated chloride channel homolog